MNPAMTIYADYQATTPVDPSVLERMAPYWNESFGNPHSSDHATGWRADKAVGEAASSVANLIGADADEIVFTSGATEANNLALFGLARRASPGRNRILVSAVEHKCILAAAHALATREGFIVETIPVNKEGFIDPGSIEKRLDDSVLMVSVIAVNNEIGTIQDVSTIAATLTAEGIPLHCDAAQAPCAMDVRHLATHADMVSLSGHKMYGPQGIGALVIRRDLHNRIEPLIYGGGQQSGLRSGTVPLPLCVGMGAAAAVLTNGEPAGERVRIARQRDRFIELLRLSGTSFAVNGPTTARRHPGNANLRFDGIHAQEILGTLQPQLAASSGAACASGTVEPSHVLRAIGLSAPENDASIRFSFGRFTTDEEIDVAAKMVVKALKCLTISRGTQVITAPPSGRTPHAKMPETQTQTLSIDETGMSQN